MHIFRQRIYDARPTQIRQRKLGAIFREKCATVEVKSAFKNHQRINANDEFLRRVEAQIAELEKQA
jgi:hypothetical protein